MSDMQIYKISSDSLLSTMKSSALRNDAVLNKSVFTAIDTNSDGVISVEEAKKFGFSLWEIKEDISKTDFFAKLKSFSEQINKFAANLDKPEAKSVSKKNEMKSKNHSNAYDARGKDISKLSLSEAELLNLRIDDSTILSNEQRKIIETAKEKMKDPGLGIKSLHARGITGKGVKIAIIDQTFTEHREYSAQVAHVEKINTDANTGSKHAPAVASIAVGKETGVAPDAQLYCFTSDRTDKNGKTIMKNDAVAIRRIMEINNTLPENERISVISISAKSYEDGAEGQKEYLEAIKAAKESGLFVVTVNLDTYNNAYLLGADRDPKGDVNDVASYRPSNMIIEGFKHDSPNETQKKEILLVPQDHRTIADGYGDKSYEYEGNQGGYSWTVPYLAGTFALAKQVNPNITPEEFLQQAKETATECNYNGQMYGKIINPKALMERIQATLN